MRQNSSGFLGFIVLAAYALVAPVSHAQSGFHGRTAPRTAGSPATRDLVRGGQDGDAPSPGIGSAARRGRTGGRDVPRTATRRTALGGSAGSRVSDDDDPLSRYGSPSRSEIAARLESSPRTPPPPREAPRVRHNYFPDMPSGQRHHCVPSRGQLLGMRR